MPTTVRPRKNPGDDPGSLIALRSAVIVFLATLVGACVGIGAGSVVASAGGSLVAVVAGLGSGSAAALATAEALHRLIAK